MSDDELIVDDAVDAPAAALPQLAIAEDFRISAAGVELAALQATGAVSGRFGRLWGRSSAMRSVYEQIARVAATSASVFITGESGTGKEVVAQTVHELSRRRRQPFLAVNCGAISPQLIESELFGHERGSFTGADRQHRGFFERAHGGTLFLDEITEMPPELQVKLLRVLETGRFMRVGSTRSQQSDVRLIAASNRPLARAVADRRLREDLYYRLNVFPVELPPLRERGDDIELLAGHFLAEVNEREAGRKTFSPAALACLRGYAWPGNVRELRNVVQRAFVMAADPVIGDEWLPRPAGAADPVRCGTAAAPSVVVRLGASLAEAERELILATLQHFEHQRERTAAVLGISLKTLYNRLKEYRKDGLAPTVSAARR